MGATGTSVSRALIVLVTLVHAGCSSGADTPDSPAAPTTGSPSSSSPAATREATDAATPWTGPVRTDAVLPVISRRRARSWTDPRDTAPAEIDIRSVDSGASDFGGGEWQFRLAARPPLDPARRTVAYGVMVDGDGDHEADCQIGVDNDASRMGELRAWVTNLRTDETEVEDGGPYGDPIEFAHPAERGVGPRTGRRLAAHALWLLLRETASPAATSPAAEPDPGGLSLCARGELNPHTLSGTRT